MLNAICITTNQLEHIQTNLCIHLSYLEDQRNLKIYNKNIKKKKKDCLEGTVSQNIYLGPSFYLMSTSGKRLRLLTHKFLDFIKYILSDTRA